MIKLRTMIIDADKSGVDSTSVKDNRITKVGRIIRRYKLDELTQLTNVLLGQMSLVGPRPQVKRDMDLYTDVEKQLLDTMNISQKILDTGELAESVNFWAAMNKTKQALNMTCDTTIEEGIKLYISTIQSGISA